MGDQRDPELVAALEDAAAERPVVEGRERDLHRRHGRELERLVQLPAIDVREPDVPDEPLLREPGESAHRRPPGRPRIRRVEEIEIDRQAVERVEARFAVGADRLRAAVQDPRAAGPCHATLRHDPSGRGAARVQRAGEQPLVALVCARGVEDGDAGRGRGGDDPDERVLLQPHAAESDAKLVVAEPGRRAAACQAPLAFAASTAASPAGSIRPAASSRSTRSTLEGDQRLLARRGVNMSCERCPSTVRWSESIQPKQSASSTAAPYPTAGFPVGFFQETSHAPGALSWFAASQSRHSARVSACTRSWSSAAILIAARSGGGAARPGSSRNRARRAASAA